MSEEMAKKMWASGSYAIVGDWFGDASRRALDDLDLSGERVLDVACGTGAVAIEAAKRGAQVTGVDITPEMLEEAGARACTVGVELDLCEGSFTDLSAWRDVDVVTSSFGVIFAQDQPAVARELVDAARPGGIISLAAWAPDGAFGGVIPPELLELFPDFSKRANPTAWANEDALKVILADLPVTEPVVTRHTIEIAFESADDALAQMRKWSGPWIALYQMLEQFDAVEFATGLFIRHFEEFCRKTDDGVALQVDYCITRFEKLPE